MGKTQDNLKAAFAGEAKASVRLKAFAAKAETEGYGPLAKLFRAVAEAEGVHALRHLRHMKLVGPTEENL
jgi:rubrerythrin